MLVLLAPEVLQALLDLKVQLDLEGSLAVAVTPESKAYKVHRAV
jgi:hypothetical protein